MSPAPQPQSRISRQFRKAPEAHALRTAGCGRPRRSQGAASPPLPALTFRGLSNATLRGDDTLRCVSPLQWNTTKATTSAYGARPFEVALREAGSEGGARVTDDEGSVARGGGWQREQSREQRLQRRQQARAARQLTPYFQF